MKTTLTITVDCDVKERALRFIEQKRESSLSSEINEFLKRLIKENGTNG